MNIIAITGGIGSGKSIVSRILSAMNYEVYDCDSNAKRIMATSCEIKRELVEAFGNDVIASAGEIASKTLSGIVFGDEIALKRLNSIVHPKVKADILEWAQMCTRKLVFIETAILRESNLTDIISKEWNVYAPVDERIKRVMRRSNLTEEEVRRRITMQEICEFGIENQIINDGNTPVLPQIIEKLHFEED